MNARHPSDGDTVNDIHRSTLTDEELNAARSNEKGARLLGRNGRKLLAEVEYYLEFFAIARSAA
jgi:hypothetical protein